MNGFEASMTCQEGPVKCINLKYFVAKDSKILEEKKKKGAREKELKKGYRKCKRLNKRQKF